MKGQNFVSEPRRSLLSRIGPGILIAATGVGAGDLATGAFTGSQLGLAILWVVVVGAFLKFVLNEGLARWQLASGTTFLEGAIQHGGWFIRTIFFVYLIIWSISVGAALMSACGVATTAIADGLFPTLFSSDAEAAGGPAPETGKQIFGIIHSVLALVLVRLGGFRLFEKVMSFCIAVMFLTVIATVVFSSPDWGAVVAGLTVPRIPKLHDGGLAWSVALMGGVGGTLTILCYGYWIREEGRNSPDEIAACRLDLGVGYLVTAVFGMGMVILADGMTVSGKGATLIVDLAGQLTDRLGEFGHFARWAFLLGAWGAVFSSLLGVWQSVPYLFADFWQMRKQRPPGERLPAVDVNSRPYLVYLVLLTFVPMVGLFVEFQAVQQSYAILGAAFMPLLAAGLLILNGFRQFVGEKHTNSDVTNIVLAGTILFFVWAAWLKFSG